MKTVADRLMTTLLLAWLLGMWWAMPGNAFPLAPPQESLAGLTPGMNTIADASRIYSVHNVMLPGIYSAYSGGRHGTDGYHWTNGVNGRVPGLVVETAIGSSRIDAVVVDGYPGLGTSHGLMALIPEVRAVQAYGLPDFAYELRVGGSLEYREIFYLNRGLLVLLAPRNGGLDWVVDRLILTYPTYLRNAVAFRSRAARSGSVVTDISDTYATWVRMITVSPRPAPAQ